MNLQQTYAKLHMNEIYFILTKPYTAHVTLHYFFMGFIIFKIMNRLFRN